MEHSLTVDFDGRAVTYDWIEADQLVLAYAISVHKFQGSEFPAVVMPMVTQHYMMLQRNLLYTAITGPKAVCAGRQPPRDRYGGEEQPGSGTVHRPRLAPAPEDRSSYKPPFDGHAPFKF